MEFGPEEIDRIATAYEAFALRALAGGETAPRLHRHMSDIETGARAMAEAAGWDSAAMEQRIGAGRTALVTAGEAADVGTAREVLAQVVQGRLATQIKSPEPLPIQPGAPIGRFWHVEQRLTRMHCREETSNAATGTLGKDEILLTGTYVYTGQRRLQSYDEEFNTGDTDKPDKFLMREMVPYGYHRFTATHRMFELDATDAATAAWLSDKFTNFIEALIKTALTGGRAAVRAALSGAIPGGVSPDVALPIIDRLLDALEDLIDWTAGRVLERAEEWLTSILGPDAFYPFKSSFTTFWGHGQAPIIAHVSLQGKGQPVQAFVPSSGASIYVGDQDVEVRMPGAQPGAYVAALRIVLS